MMNKSKFLLFALTLYSTSTAFGMDDDSEYKQTKTPSSAQTTVAKKRTIKEVKRARETSFNLILNLYKDQAEYHEHMNELLIQQREKLRSALSAEDREEHNKIVTAVFGLAAEKIIVSSDTKDSISIEDFIKEMSIRHHTQSNIYKDIFARRKKNFSLDEDSIFTQLAAMYRAAIEQLNDTEDSLLERKKALLSLHYSEEEIEAFYETKLQRDKCALYKLVQNKILEEFKLNSDKIFFELINLCKQSLRQEKEVDLFQGALFDAFIKKHDSALGHALKNEQKAPMTLKMSPKTVQFCQDVINGRYKFPSLENFEELVLAFNSEEEQSGDAAQETATSTAKSEKNKKKRQRKKRAKQEKQLQKNTSSTPLTTASITRIGNSTDVYSASHGPESESQEPIGTTSHAGHNGPSEVPSAEKTMSSFVGPETGNQSLHSLSLVEHEEEEDSVMVDLEKIYEKDRQAKKKKHKKAAPSMSMTVELKDAHRARINKKQHTFLTKILGHPVNLNLRWKRIVTLFNSPSGFKGKVYGGNDGSTNTFEIYIKFQKGRITSFLSKQEFQKLKEDAEPESRTERNFLPENERLQSYKLNSGESIGTSFFTLHNPHPCAVAYRKLVERLQKQLGLLGITPETIGSAED